MENIGPLDVSKHDNDVRSKTKARMMEEKKRMKGREWWAFL